MKLFMFILTYILLAIQVGCLGYAKINEVEPIEVFYGFPIWGSMLVIIIVIIAYILPNDKGGKL